MLSESYPKVVRFLRSYKTTLVLLLPIGLYYLRFIRRPDGMILFPAGAQCMLNEQSLSVCLTGFTYPPLFAFVMIPFVFLPMWLRNVVWYILSVSLLYYSFRLCEYLTRKTFAITFVGNELMWFRALSFILSLKFILSVLENQSYDYLVFFFILLGIYGLVERNDMSTSFGLSFAAALKATPVLFFPYILFQRRWKSLAACIALFLFFSFLPDLFFTPKDLDTGYFTGWVQDIATPALSGAKSPVDYAFWEGENPLNQSLRSFVYRIATRLNLHREFYKILYVVYGVLIFFAGCLLLKSAKFKYPFIFDASVLLIVMLMLSPISSKSHFVVLMLPYMVIVGYLIKQRSFRNSVSVLLLLSFILHSLTSTDLVGTQVARWGSYMGSVTIGTIVVLIALAMVISEVGRRNLIPDKKT